MLCKLGVDISRLHRGMRRALNPIDKVYKKYGEEAVVSSTFEGNHSPSSLHYDDKAVDFRKHGTKAIAIRDDLKRVLGNDYDVIAEGTHLHVEFDTWEG